MLHSGSKLNLLIGINIAVFLLVNIPATLETLFFNSANIAYISAEYLALTANLHELPLRFWTPLSYMFMHAGIFHIVFNLLWLYWFGQIFEEFLGKKKTLGLYLLGGLSGAVLFVLAFNTIPYFTVNNAALNSSMVGASASVMAILVATATLLPDYTIGLMFIGPVKLKWLVLVFIIIDFFGTVGPNAGGEIAHLGGAILGFVYIKRLQKGHDWIAGIHNFFAGIFTKRSKLKVVSTNNSRSATGYPRQEEIDQVLDKISKTGYDNLTKQEKEILFRASKNEGK